MSKLVQKSTIQSIDCNEEHQVKTIFINTLNLLMSIFSRITDSKYFVIFIIIPCSVIVMYFTLILVINAAEVEEQGRVEANRKYSELINEYEENRAKKLKSNIYLKQ